MDGMSPDRDATLGVILTELRDMRREQGEMRAALGVLQAMDGQHRQNIEKFWAENWAPLKAELVSVNERLTSLERAQTDEVERLTDRVVNIERAAAVAEALAHEAKRRGAVTGGATGAFTVAIFESVRYFWENLR